MYDLLRDLAGSRTWECFAREFYRRNSKRYFWTGHDNFDEFGNDQKTNSPADFIQYHSKSDTCYGNVAETIKLKLFSIIQKYNEFPDK